MTEKRILGIVYLYVFVPTAIFLLGWVKIWISVPVCLFLVCAFKTVLKADIGLSLPAWNGRNIIQGIIILLIIAVWVYFSGIGNFVWQNSDHRARNALYEMLVVNKWPVIKNVVYEDGVQLRGLIYYIGYWLPAALIGKMCGMAAGYLFQYIWAVLGVFLGVILLNAILKKWSIWHLILFILFSGLDAMGCVLSGNLDPVLSFAHIEWWNAYQFSSFTTQLYWVYNQAIYAWVLTALIMIQKNNRHILCIWSLGMVVCTFSAAGIVPFVIYKIVKNRKSEIFNGLLSLENVLGGVVAVICFFYLTGNRSVHNSVLSAAALQDLASEQGIAEWVIGYILFIMVEIGIYYLYIYRYHKKDWLFYLSLGTLLLCPLIKVGSGGDFCMRASIPSLLILFYMVADSVRKDMAEKTVCRYIIIIVLAVGSMTAIHEMGRSVSNTVLIYQQDHEAINPIAPEEKMLQSNNFSGNVEDNFFFRYIAK